MEGTLHLQGILRSLLPLPSSCPSLTGLTERSGVRACEAREDSRSIEQCGGASIASVRPLNCSIPKLNSGERYTLYWYLEFEAKRVGGEPGK
jgi:hypothetical protein